MKLILSGTIQKISTRVDKTLSVVVGTQEMDSECAGKLFHFRDKFLKILLSDDEITKQEEKLVSAAVIKEDKKKEFSPSQNVRFSIYNYYKQLNEGSEDGSEEFYKSEMSKIRMHYENKTYELIELKKTILKK